MILFLESWFSFLMIAFLLSSNSSSGQLCVSLSRFHLLAATTKKCGCTGFLKVMAVWRSLQIVKHKNYS